MKFTGITYHTRLAFQLHIINLQHIKKQINKTGKFTAIIKS
jgi:hypothetical protein